MEEWASSERFQTQILSDAISEANDSIEKAEQAEKYLKACFNINTVTL